MRRTTVVRLFIFPSVNFVALSSVLHLLPSSRRNYFESRHPSSTTDPPPRPQHLHLHLHLHRLWLQRLWYQRLQRRIASRRVCR